MPDFLLIGEFARRCGLPVSALRFYDRIGLLRPAAADPTTGYRWYRADQIPTARFANQLRSLGVPPRLIAQVLTGGPAAVAALRTERDRLRTELAARQANLTELERLLAAVAAPALPRLVDLPAEPVVALPVAAQPADLPAVVRRGVARLRTALRRHGRTWAEPWGGAFPATAPRTPAEVVHGFVFVRLADQPVLAEPALDGAWLPGGPAAEIIHQGGSHAVGAAYQAAFDFIAATGRSAAGPVVEEYLAADRIRVLVPFAA
jgi:DNA-binding transcriptional MerR regulator